MEEIIIHDLRMRGIGLAREMLSRIKAESGMADLVPVGIERDALAFWDHMAKDARLNVRPGITGEEMRNEICRHRYGPEEEWGFGEVEPDSSMRDLPRSPSP